MAYLRVLEKLISDNIPFPIYGDQTETSYDYYENQAFQVSFMTEDGRNLEPVVAVKKFFNPFSYPLLVGKQIHDDKFLQSQENFFLKKAISLYGAAALQLAKKVGVKVTPFELVEFDESISEISSSLEDPHILIQLISMAKFKKLIGNRFYISQSPTLFQREVLDNSIHIFTPSILESELMIFAKDSAFACTKPLFEINGDKLLLKFGFDISSDEYVRLFKL